MPRVHLLYIIIIERKGEREREREREKRTTCRCMMRLDGITLDRLEIKEEKKNIVVSGFLPTNIT